ncbi:MAG: type IIL restriction-modification enzyme MmeI, partial [Terrimicrobiaceae bacterium]
EVALEWLQVPNPHGRPTSDVLRFTFNAMDVTRRPSWLWNIDFGTMAESEACLYEKPFEWVKLNVWPERQNHREAIQVKCWWRFARPCSDMRVALAPYARYLATPRVSKHRVFAWLGNEVIPDSALTVFARDDDFFFGVLHSRFHEVWALAQGTQLREKESGFRYTPTTCFETFPFPEPTEPQRASIAAAARELNALRERWLNPPEWTREEILEFPATPGGPWTRFIDHSALRDPHSAVAKYPRLVPADAKAAAELKKRTLTNLYNQRPAWLANAHAALDAAVADAYGFAPDLPEPEILAKLLESNLAGGATESCAK